MKARPTVAVPLDDEVNGEMIRAALVEIAQAKGPGNGTVVLDQFGIEALAYLICLGDAFLKALDRHGSLRPVS